MSDQIARVWKGWGRPAGVERYCREHFSTHVLPQLRSIDGFVGARVLTRSELDETEVVVATFWSSLDSVKFFAGEDYERAVVEPVVRELLHRFDDRVTHFTVALTTS